MSGHAYAALLGIGIPTCLLFSGSAVLLSRDKTVSSFLQLLGAGCLMVVVLTHIFETFHLLPWMQWGVEHGAGHYLDFACAVLGLMLFSIACAYKATRGVDSRKGRDWNGDCRIMAQRGRELLRATKYEKQR